MSTTEVHNASTHQSVRKLDFHLEVEIIPVSDVDRAKKFYERLGWRLDADDAPSTGSVSSSSRPPAPTPRSRSARDSPTPCLARPKGASLSPTSKPPMANSLAVAST
jgi:hypothetical protein